LLELQGSRTLAVMNTQASVSLLAATKADGKVSGAHTTQASNRSIERTSSSQLRWLAAAAHAER